MKSIFPVFYMYYLLKTMNYYSEDKPLSKIFNTIKLNTQKNNIIEDIENKMNLELGIIKYKDSNIDQV